MSTEERILDAAWALAARNGVGATTLLAPAARRHDQRSGFADRIARTTMLLRAKRSPR